MVERPTPYGKKLRDPRWQRRRLEILERDGWACALCGDDISTLAVHHRWYEKDIEPWEQSNESLVTLCERCHQLEYDERPGAETALLRALRRAGFWSFDLEILAKAFSRIQTVGNRGDEAMALSRLIHAKL